MGKDVYIYIFRYIIYISISIYQVFIYDTGADLLQKIYLEICDVVRFSGIETGFCICDGRLFLPIMISVTISQVSSLFSCAADS